VTGLSIFLVVACSSPQFKTPSAPDQGWERFVKIVGDLWHNENYDEEFLQGLKELGLDEKYASGWGGKLIIANPPKTEAKVRPEPKVWKTDKQILACSGDICGDSRPEYVLGMGWMGPSGGVLCLYDSGLRKVAEVKTECLWGMRLQDLTDDGKNEIICWSDAHHGSGLWDRRISIYKYFDDIGLKIVWEGGLYEQMGGHLDKYEIQIKDEKGRPAVIMKKHVLSQFSEYSSDPKKTDIRFFKLHPTETYMWSIQNRQFEKVNLNH
jgi:hypothetical protein